jgi:hypothetical protein
MIDSPQVLDSAIRNVQDGHSDDILPGIVFNQNFVIGEFRLVNGFGVRELDVQHIGFLIMADVHPLNRKSFGRNRSPALWEKTPAFLHRAGVSDPG